MNNLIVLQDHGPFVKGEEVKELRVVQCGILEVESQKNGTVGLIPDAYVAPPVPVLTLNQALKSIDGLRQVFDLYRIGKENENETQPRAVVVDSRILNALKVIVQAAEDHRECLLPF